MNENLLKNICKYGAIGSFLFALLGTVLLFMFELDIIGGQNRYNDNQFAMLLVFSFTFLTIGFTAIGILLHVGTISEEMQIRRYLEQKNYRADEEE